MMRKDRAFILLFSLVVILTIGFTIYYIWRVSNPLSLVKEEIYISFDGREQTVSGIYYFRNHLPMNASIPMEYSIPSDGNLSEAIMEEIRIGTSGRNQDVEFTYTGTNTTRFTVNIPPFSDIQLAIKYRQITTGGRLSFPVRTSGEWGPARKDGMIYLKLPDDYTPGDDAGNFSQASGEELWDWSAILPRDYTGERMDITLKRE